MRIALQSRKFSLAWVLVLVGLLVAGCDSPPPPADESLQNIAQSGIVLENTFLLDNGMAFNYPSDWQTPPFGMDGRIWGSNTTAALQRLETRQMQEGDYVLEIGIAPTAEHVTPNLRSLYGILANEAIIKYTIQYPLPAMLARINATSVGAGGGLANGVGTDLYSYQVVLNVDFTFWYVRAYCHPLEIPNCYQLTLAIAQSLRRDS